MALVARQHVLKRRRAIERVVERKAGVAAQAEDHLDTVRLQHFHDRFGAGERGRLDFDRLVHVRNLTAQAQQHPQGAQCGMKTLLLVVTVLALAGCNREGPAEKAGRQVDKAGEAASRSIEKAGENVRDAVKGKN
jgi:hypothetical protein